MIEDYCRARFGAAAPAKVDYYGVLEKRMEEIPDLYSNEVWDNHLILTPEVRAACREVLARAVAAAGSERARAHVQTMVDLQRSTDAMADAVEHARETGDFGAAAQKMAVVFEVRDRLNALYKNFMNSTRLDDKRKEQYMTGGIYNQWQGFDERIRGAAASLLLPRRWHLMLDTRNHAVPLGYHRPEVAVDQLEEHDVTVCPDVKFGTHREMAAFFYRTQVDVPADFAGKDVVLYFPSIIARALQIWINGEPVAFDHGTHTEHIWRGPTYFWMSYDHALEFDVTAHVRPGEKNTIAFRVFKSYDFAGTYRRIFLLADEPEPAIEPLPVE